MSKKKNFLDKVPATPLEQSLEDAAVDPFISVLSKPKDTEDGPASASTSSTGLNPPPVDKESAAALLNPPIEEKRNRHFHLVLKPSLFKQIEDASSRSNVSMSKFLTVGAELLLSAIERKSNQ